MDENDYDPSTYNVDELLDIIGLNGLNPTADEIRLKTNSLARKYDARENHRHADFFMQIQDYLIALWDNDNNPSIDAVQDSFTTTDDLEESAVDISNAQIESFKTFFNAPTEQSEEQSEEEQSEEEQSDGSGDERKENEDDEESSEDAAAWGISAGGLLPSKRSDRIPPRNDAFEVFSSNEHLPMTRTQLGVDNTFKVPIVQDTLNPNLKNTIVRTLHVDSQFRPTGSNSADVIDSGATDFTFNLSDPVLNVTTMTLTSVQIPRSWYVFDDHLQNTYCWVQITHLDGDSNEVTSRIKVQITPGTYSSDALIAEFDAALQRSNITPPSDSTDTALQLNANNGLYTLQLIGWDYTPPDDETSILIQSDGSAQVIFFSSDASESGRHMDGTFGWTIGFRELELTLTDENGYTASSVPRLSGTKSFILAIDDYNQNRVNNAVISIGEQESSNKYPAYYNDGQPQTRGVNGEVLALPSAPRSLSSAQLRTINETAKSRIMPQPARGRAPIISDTFALLPIDSRIPGAFGSVYVDTSTSLQTNVREYFGPVSLRRLRVRLLDDRGHVVNLHGLDWGVTIRVESLYQY